MNVSTYVYGVHALIMERVNLAVREQAVGEQRQQDKLGKGQELIARQDELGPSIITASVHNPSRCRWGGGYTSSPVSDSLHYCHYLPRPCTSVRLARTHVARRVDIPPRLASCGPPCCTCVRILAGPLVAAMQKAKNGNGGEDSDSVYGGGGGSGSWLLYEGEAEDALVVCG